MTAFKSEESTLLTVFFNVGVNKAEALAKLTERMGLSLESVACLGDGDNDREMLK